MSTVFLQYPPTINPYSWGEIEKEHMSAAEWKAQFESVWETPAELYHGTSARAASEDVESQNLALSIREEIDAEILNDLTTLAGDVNSFHFSVGGGEMLAIKPDGTVKIPDNVTLDQAAKAFWDTVSYHAPENITTIRILEEQIVELKTKLQGYETDKKVDDYRSEKSLLAPSVTVTVPAPTSCDAYDPLSRTEDFISINPKQTAGRGSRVEVLPGGQGLGDLYDPDLEYFRKNMQKGLRIPPTKKDKPIKVELISTPTQCSGGFHLEHFLEVVEKEKTSNAFDDAMKLVKQ